MNRLVQTTKNRVKNNTISNCHILLAEFHSLTPLPMQKHVFTCPTCALQNKSIGHMGHLMRYPHGCLQPVFSLQLRDFSWQGSRQEEVKKAPRGVSQREARLT